MRPLAARYGFSLIELLVTMSVIALLVGMASPIVALSQRNALRASTGAILAKADSALRMFRNDNGGYPYQLKYPTADADGTFLAADFDNRLAYNIGADIRDPALTTVRNDINAAATAFTYNVVINGRYGGFTENPQTSPVVFKISSLINDTSVHGSDIGNGEYQVRVIWQNNFMAQSRARQAMAAGAVDIVGPVINKNGVLVQNKSSDLVIPTAACQSKDRPGWAENYLNGEIEPRHRRGDTLLDASGNPLVYISRNVGGIKTGIPRVVGWSLYPWDTRMYGIGDQGFNATEGPGPQLITANRCLLLYSGRIALSRDAAGDGKPTPTHAQHFPDLANLMRSDIRYYCAPGMEKEFEVWSAGRDGKFNYMRDASENFDNIPAQAHYLRGIR